MLSVRLAVEGVYRGWVRTWQLLLSSKRTGTRLSAMEGAQRVPERRTREGGGIVSERTYVSIAQIGNCRVCGREQDLRYGVCFTCSDQIKGERISETTHRLWDSKNPRNEWYVSETGH